MNLHVCILKTTNNTKTSIATIKLSGESFETSIHNMLFMELMLNKNSLSVRLSKV